MSLPSKHGRYSNAEVARHVAATDSRQTRIAFTDEVNRRLATSAAAAIVQNRPSDRHGVVADGDDDYGGDDYSYAPATQPASSDSNALNPSPEPSSSPSSSSDLLTSNDSIESDDSNAAAASDDDGNADVSGDDDIADSSPASTVPSSRNSDRVLRPRVAKQSQH
ncbi:MAG: hypothetical protein VXZ18_16935 [Pseudomonadota bacterium]|nr:hypothetical protein [Pseudomonadota bacterium]